MTRTKDEIFKALQYCATAEDGRACLKCSYYQEETPAGGRTLSDCARLLMDAAQVLKNKGEEKLAEALRICADTYDRSGCRPCPYYAASDRPGEEMHRECRDRLLLDAAQALD